MALRNSEVEVISSQYEIHLIYADLYRTTVHSFPLLTSPSTLHFEVNMIYWIVFPYHMRLQQLSTLCWELQPQAFQTTEKFIFKTCQAQILHGRRTLFLVRQILRLLQTQKSSETKLTQSLERFLASTMCRSKIVYIFFVVVATSWLHFLYMGPHKSIKFPLTHVLRLQPTILRFINVFGFLGISGIFQKIP